MACTPRPAPSSASSASGAGPLLAARDRFTIEITGKGAHAWRPHEGVDPVVVAAHTITALQTIASRNDQPAGRGGGVDLHGACGRGVQHHSRERHADGYGADAERERCADRAGAPDGNRAKARRPRSAATAAVNYEGDVPVTMNDPEKTKLAVQRGARGGRGGQRARRCAAVDGGGGLRPHAQAAAGRLHPDRQRTGPGPAHARIQF